MRIFFWSVTDRGRFYAFPAAWVAVLAAGIGLRQPVLAEDPASFLAFDAVGYSAPETASVPPMHADTMALIFVRHDLLGSDDPNHFRVRDGGREVVRESVGSHGRFAAPGNFARRHVEMRAVNPRTASELAGFYNNVSYWLSEIRQGQAVPPIKVERVSDDLGSKDGTERKELFIIALLPVVLEVNQRVLAEREQLLSIRERTDAGGVLTAAGKRWLEDLAVRYETTPDRMDELVRRVDMVPPSMAIAQAGVESGWGTSFAARAGNALFGQIQVSGRHSVAVPWKPGAGMPQPFASVGESAEAYVTNLNTHPAYAAFRAERAAGRERGDPPNGYQLIGQLLRYSELGHEYVRFVRLIMRENGLSDFDRARLPSL